MTQNELYLEKWVGLNEKMENKNMTWGALEEDDDFHQYMAFNVKTYSPAQYLEIQTATQKIGDVLNVAYKKILDKYTDEQLHSILGIPLEALKAVRVKNDGLFSYFTRLDLIVNDLDVKVIEINCDTPTGYLETQVGNEIICKDKGLSSLNNLEFSIFKAWRMIEKQYDLFGKKVYFTSYGEHEEDRQTVLFNMKCSGMVSEYIAVEDITIDENGLYDAKGNLIENLYRLYPLEFLPTDVDNDGKEIGKMFLDHIATGKVKIINPPSAFLMQSKAVMAIVWENRYEFFNEDMVKDVEKYFLPTFFNNTTFLQQGKEYVEKPIFGREGGGVKIFDHNNQIVEKDGEDWYSEWLKIYQEYVEMPTMTLDTWDGEYTGKLLVGSFYIGGEPSGLFLRVGEKITGNLSMFCGVAMASEEGVFN